MNTKATNTLQCIFSCLRGYVTENAQYRLQIGGERTYGWGKIVLYRCHKYENLMFHHYNVELNGKVPIIELAQGDKIPLHIKAEGDNESAIIVGNVEPLVRREWREGPGFAVTFGGVSYMPGSKCLRRCKVAIGSLGYGTIEL